jgi:16S rRNA C967 or C1407 C5-methylase (RsmB/RsmF family)
VARNMENIKLLNSKQAIMDYIEFISEETCTEYMFNKWVKKGLPARFEDNRWIAYAENIDLFFKKYTFVSMAKDVDKIENN